MSSAAFFLKVDRLIAAVIKPLVVVLSLSVALLMVAGIVSREVLGEPLLGLEELILTGVMWLYMMGAALASRERSHLQGDFVQVLTSSQTVRRRVRLLASLITVAMAIVFTVWAFSLLSWGLNRQQSTAVLRIPLYVAQSSLFACSVLMVLYALRDVVHDVRAVREAVDH